MSDSDLHFRDAEHPSTWPPGHSWLQKCICEERLSIEKCYFLSVLHFSEIQGSRSETFRLHRFSFTSDSLSPNSLPGVAVLTSIYTKGFHVLQATSCRLQARGGRLQATGNRLQVRSNSKPGATSSRQQATGWATGYKHHVLGWTPRSFRYVGGLSESSDFHLYLLAGCCALKLFFKHVGYQRCYLCCGMAGGNGRDSPSQYTFQLR